jgi:hypothetical protein
MPAIFPRRRGARLSSGPPREGRVRATDRGACELTRLRLRRLRARRGQDHRCGGWRDRPVGRRSADRGPTATPSAAALRARGAQSRCVGCRLEIVTPEPTPLSASEPASRRSSRARGPSPARHVAYAQDERSDRSVGFPSRPAFAIAASGSSATRRSDYGNARSPAAPHERRCGVTELQAVWLGLRLRSRCTGAEDDQGLGGDVDGYERVRLPR